MSRGPDPELVATVLDSLRRGYSHAEVAEACGRSLSWVKRVDSDHRVAAMRASGMAAPKPKRRARKADAADPGAPAADPLAPPDQLGDASALGTLRAVVADLRRAQHEAVANGDVRAQQHIARTLSTALPNLARLERASRDDSDVLRVTRAELDAARRTYRERVAAIVARPLTCARCGAALRAELAGVDLDAEAATAPAVASAAPSAKPSR